MNKVSTNCSLILVLNFARKEMVYTGTLFCLSGGSSQCTRNLSFTDKISSILKNILDAFVFDILNQGFKFIPQVSVVATAFKVINDTDWTWSVASTCSSFMIFFNFTVHGFLISNLLRWPFQSSFLPSFLHTRLYIIFKQCFWVTMFLSCHVHVSEWIHTL